MNEAGTDAASRLWWAAKRLLPLILVLLVAGGVLGATKAPVVLGRGEQPTYEARSLVLATQLELDPELLPKTAVAIFEGGDVADRVARIDGVDVPKDEIIPDVVDIRPVENSVALQVIGRHTDPAVAARLSNVAASVLLSELNASGDLFGRFIVQQRAATPLQPEDQVGPAVGAAVGTAAGLAFVLGIVGLYVAVRRPVLTPEETSAAVGAPVLGTPRLPRGPVDPLRVPGLSALSKLVFPERRETAVIVGVPGDRGERSSMALLLARVLGRTGPVHLVTEADLSEVLSDEERLDIRDSTMLEVDQRQDGTPAIVDGPTAKDFDVPQFLPADARVVLVVREGTPTGVLEKTAAQFLPGEVLGILFMPVKRGHHRPSKPAPAGPPRFAPSEQRTVDPRSTAAEPGPPADRKPPPAGPEPTPAGPEPTPAGPEPSPAGPEPTPTVAATAEDPSSVDQRSGVTPSVRPDGAENRRGRPVSSRGPEEPAAFRAWALDGREGVEPVQQQGRTVPGDPAAQDEDDTVEDVEDGPEPEHDRGNPPHHAVDWRVNGPPRD